ncbi:MAG: glycoside hydrolase family 16 protein [bacterium]|nr:glycoside hydrolase family 16 protein [bacterium]
MKHWVFRTGLAALMLVSAACKDKNPSRPTNGEDIPAPPGWKLAWHDEFDGAAIDRSRWGFRVDGEGGGNNELQYYTGRDTNAFIEDGCLVIRALRETYTGEDGTRSYTSARLYSQGAGWKYGRFEFRAKLPFGQGIWPAIWMMPLLSTYGGWAASGEIDIMELLGHEPSRVYGTLHFGGTYPDNRQSGASFTLPSGSFSEDFHLFALEWDTTEFRWFVDDSLYSVKDQSVWYTTAAPRPAPFDQAFYLIFNVAVGGNWPGDPDGSTVFPQRMDIDYVRIYEKDT